MIVVVVGMICLVAYKLGTRLAQTSSPISIIPDQLTIGVGGESGLAGA